MKSILEIKNLKGRTGLVRVDFNIPLVNGKKPDESESWRIEKSLDTIKYLSKMGAKVVLVSHIGRNPKDSLLPIIELINKYIPVRFIPMLQDADVPDIVENLLEGEVVLLENLRSNPGEEANTQEFSAFLASLADFYVNEAFSVSHRHHASIVGVTKFLPSYTGLWFLKEIDNLKKLDNPEKPFLFILGGSKFETKVPLIEKFSNIADSVFIGGALANNFFKSIGFETGKSVLDENFDVGEFFEKENIKIPFDVMTDSGETKAPNELGKNEIIMDMGKDTLEDLKNSVLSSKTVLWNGPLGFYEKGFDLSSKEILKTLAESGSFSVVGGGDTVKLLKELGLVDQISFVSTGGGAMLEFLSSGTLPGIDALNQQQN